MSATKRTCHFGASVFFLPDGARGVAGFRCLCLPVIRMAAQNVAIWKTCERNLSVLGMGVFLSTFYLSATTFVFCLPCRRAGPLVHWFPSVGPILSTLCGKTASGVMVNGVGAH